MSTSWTVAVVLASVVGATSARATQVCSPVTTPGIPWFVESTLDDELPYDKLPIEISKFTNALAVRAADFNNDGVMDLVFGGNSDPAVVVYYLATSGNTLVVDHTELLALPYSVTCYDLQIADLNGDGCMDIVVGRHLSKTDVLVSDSSPTSDDLAQETAASDPICKDAFFLNDGGTILPDEDRFPESMAYFVEGLLAAPISDQRATLGLGIGLIDGDAVPDMVSGGDDYSVRFYKGVKGKGRFNFRFQYVRTYEDGITGETGAARCRLISLNDYDQDGDLDMIVSRANGVDPDRIWVNAGPPDDPFVKQVTPVLQRPPPAVISFAWEGGTCGLLGGGGLCAYPSGTFETALGDMDGDGLEDMVIANPTGNNAAYLNNGDGTFGCISDGKAYPDLVFPPITSSWSGTSSCLTAVCVALDPAFPFPPPPGCDYRFNVPGAALNGCTGVSLGDMNGDAKLDIVFSNRNDLDEVCGVSYLDGQNPGPEVFDWLFINTSTPGLLSFEPLSEEIGDANDGTGYGEILDLDGDGRADWLDANFANNKQLKLNHIWFGNPP